MGVAAVPPGEGHSVVCLAAAIKCFTVFSRSFSYWLSVRNFYINLLLGDSFTERAKAKGCSSYPLGGKGGGSTESQGQVWPEPRQSALAFKL